MHDLISYLMTWEVITLYMVAAEAFILVRVKKVPYNWRNTLAGCFIGAMGVFVIWKLPPVVALTVRADHIENYIWDHRLMNFPINAWTVTLAFVVFDFVMYWKHRLDHKIRYFWAAHTVHHSGLEFNLSLSRLPQDGWTRGAPGALIVLSLLNYLGLAPKHFLPLYLMGRVLNATTHLSFMPKLPRIIEYVFVTATSHRIHHAKNPEYIDKNFGGFLIIWDRIFGTYQAEIPGIPIEYGLSKPMNSYNPFKIALYGYWQLGKDLIRARRRKDFIRCLVLEGAPRQPLQPHQPGETHLTRAA